MKTILGAALTAAVLVAGCGSKQTVVGPGGSATVEQSGGNVKTTINTPEGQAVVEQNEAAGTSKFTATDASGKTTTIEATTKFDVAELGVDLYPGAKLSNEQSDAAKVETPEGTMLTVRFATPDKPDKVEVFYKKLLKSPSSFSTGETCMVSGKNAAGNDVVVTSEWNKDQGQTTVSLVVTKKK